MAIRLIRGSRPARHIARAAAWTHATTRICSAFRVLGEGIDYADAGKHNIMGRTQCMHCKRGVDAAHQRGGWDEGLSTDCLFAVRGVRPWRWRCGYLHLGVPHPPLLGPLAVQVPRAGALQLPVASASAS